LTLNCHYLLLLLLLDQLQAAEHTNCMVPLLHHEASIRGRLLSGTFAASDGERIVVHMMLLPPVSRLKTRRPPECNCLPLTDGTFCSRRLLLLLLSASHSGRTTRLRWSIISGYMRPVF
jgi:hypothetical protein